MPDSGRPFLHSPPTPTLMAALNAYMLALEDLRACRGRPYTLLNELTSHVRIAREATLADAALQPAFVTLLIGHAELVAQVCKPGRRPEEEQRLIEQQMGRTRQFMRTASALPPAGAGVARVPPAGSGSSPTGAPG